MITRALLAGLLVLPVLGVETGHVDAVSRFELAEIPDDHASMIHWAVDLVDRAGLAVPPLRFVFHDGDRTPCSDRTGRHHVVDGISVVDLCDPPPTFSTQVTILHEVAHAWAAHHLTPSRKAAFQELRGWEHWRNYEAAAWHENGTEQAAEILVWGIIDRPLAMVRIDQNSCDELDQGYRVLTGADPLHGYRDLCGPTAP